MDEESPWLTKWQITKDLSHGGQGTTKIVVRADSSLAPQTGVLKILKDQTSPEARRRMFREVTNLIALHSANCRVPRVLDSNTDRFEVPNLNLYFVMEYVGGITLAAYVRQRGGLPLAEASDIARKLCETITVAQREEILHRDLKPENIIVLLNEQETGIAAVRDVVIVDYGLSFNNRGDEPLTRISETLDNSFLSLPERRIPGGNRRDPRSDVTGLCGVFYFCITGFPPVDLVGSDNRPPHRRTGHSVREKLGDGVVTSMLESFFDCGFSPNLEVRFQTPALFAARLEELLHPTLQTPREDPIVVAERASRLLREQDRKTQLADYRNQAGDLPRLLGKHVRKYDGKLGVFGVDDSSQPHPENLWSVPGHEYFGLRFAFGVRETHHHYRIIVSYQILALANECVVFRALFLVRPGAREQEVMRQWQPLLRYDGREKPNFDLIRNDLDAVLGDCIEKLQHLILGEAKGQ